jgi:hypothetical protein
MLKLLLPVGLLIVGWVVVMIMARRNEGKVRSEWETLLSPAGEQTFQKARVQIETGTSMVGAAINEAIMIRRLGEVAEAMCFLDTGYQLIERFTPNLLSLLTIMVRFTRMMSAIAPVKPLVPSDFHLAELADLAFLERILHQILASAKQRFRLKLYVLGKGVSIASHYLMQRIKAVLNHHSTADREWNEIASIGQDYQKLSDESLQSLHALLEALSHEAARELALAMRLPTREPSRLRISSS